MDNSYIYMDVPEVFVPVNTGVPLNVTVVKNNKPYAYVEVAFFSNGILGGYAVTDSQGKASMTYFINKKGKYIVYAQSDNMESNKVILEVS